MRLGKLIERLEREDRHLLVLIEWRKDEDQETPTLLLPDGVESWRGDYSDLTISPFMLDRTYGEPTPRTVAELINELKAAVGAQFNGYKGGMFRMNDYSSVWADGHGDANGNHVVGVRIQNSYAVIRTEIVT